MSNRKKKGESKRLMLENKPARRMQLIDECEEFIKENCEQIIALIDDRLDSSRDFLRGLFLRKIREACNPMPIHYEWVPDSDTPWDYSGRLVEHGEIDSSITIRQLIEDEYTGRKEASFTSGYGWHYLTYESDFSEISNEIGEQFLCEGIRSYIEQNFSESLTEEEFDFVLFDVHDIIYDDSLVSDFFSFEAVAEYIGIADMTIRDVLKKR